MASFFGDTTIRPLQCIHSNKQYPNAVRCVNRWAVQSGLHVDLSASSSEKSFRKYFGKKITTLVYFNKDTSFNPGYRCKFAKTVKIYSLTSIKHPLRYIENLHVFDASSWIAYRCPVSRQRNRGIGGISGYKRLRHLEGESYSQNMSLKNLKALINLQVLSLTMKEEQFAQNYKIMLSIKSLRRLNLSLLSLRTEDTLTNQSEMPAISDFLIEATKRRKLDFLGMKLANIFDIIGPKSRSRFLECLSKTDIPEFDIEIIDTNISRIDPKSLRPCIKNVDLLELFVDKNTSVSIACGTRDITEKPHKKLTVIFNFRPIPSHGQIPLASSIQAETETNSLNSENSSHLESLRNLDLASKLEKLFRDCFGIPFSLSGTPNIKYLKSFSFYFPRMLEIMSKQVDPLFLATLENEIHLEHLQLQRDTGHHYFSMISETATMQNLTSLHLTDCFVQEDFFAFLSKIMENLKNLKTLRLDLHIIQPLDSKVQPKTVLIIPEKSKLIDVYIKLPVLHGNMLSDFIEFILSLNELEVLTLHYGNQLIEAEKNRLILLDGLKKLKKLREVSIFRAIPNTPFISIVRNNHKNPIVTKVQSELKELFDFSCSLWKFCIESSEPPYQIRYKRY